jgi:hypothetical protein
MPSSLALPTKVAPNSQERGANTTTIADVKKVIASGASDAEIASWLDKNGLSKSPEEVQAWSDGVEAARPFDNPDMKEWFVGVCAEASIDPATSTLFDYLEADDRISFAK